VDSSGDSGYYVDSSGNSGYYVDSSGNSGYYVDSSGNSGYYADSSGNSGYYADSSGNSLPTFRDDLSEPSSRVKSPLHLEDGTDSFPETSVINYHYCLRNNLEEPIF